MDVRTNLQNPSLPRGESGCELDKVHRRDSVDLSRSMCWNLALV